MKKTEKKALLESIKAFQEKVTTTSTAAIGDLESLVNNYLDLYRMACVNKLLGREELCVARRQLVIKLYTAFNPRDNRDHFATDPADLPQAVKLCEVDFTSDLKLAWTFFGESFGSQKVVPDGYRVSGKKIPDTVTGIKEDERRNEWSCHKIMPGGYPVPLYLELYRGSLEKIIERYISFFEKEAFGKIN